MLIKNLYVKKYTAIPNSIQKERIIQYDLCETVDIEDENIINYGIRIKSCYKNNCNEEFMLSISRDKILVENIIKYLYENSLTDLNFRDVVEDLMFEIKNLEESKKYKATKT